MIKDSNDSMKHHENAGPLQDWYGIMVLKNRKEGGEKKSTYTKTRGFFNLDKILCATDDSLSQTKITAWSFKCSSFPIFKN